MKKYWWERLNVSPSEKENVHDFMEENNFLWEVVTLPCYTLINNEYVQINKHKVCARSDDLKPMFVVKKQYKLLNNEECFQIMNKFKEQYSESKFISCGDILNQKKSYITLLLKTIKICNDEFLVYVTVTNGFDGRNAVNCTLSLIKKNDHSVFQLFDDMHKRIWTICRLDTTIDFDSLCIDIDKYIEYAKEISNTLNKKEIDLNNFIKPMFDLNWKKSKCINLHIAEEKEYIREIYLKNKGKTLYDLYMSISHYYCNHKLIRNGKLGDDLRFDLAMSGYIYELNDYAKYIIKSLDK